MSLKGKMLEDLNKSRAMQAVMLRVKAELTDK